MGRLILLRHGQSIWNKKNIFTGWIDVPLTAEGIEEALAAGREIEAIPLDVVFSSTLIRALMTAFLALSVRKEGPTPVLEPEEQELFTRNSRCYSEETAKKCLPVIRAWELNERMYGKLQGMNKQEMRTLYGDEQVQIWRRSFDVAPPEGESLKMTTERTLPYFKKKILPYLEAGKTVLISAHGNSLRSILMSLDNLTREQVVHLEVPTGKPLIYGFHKGHFTRVS